MTAPRELVADPMTAGLVEDDPKVPIKAVVAAVVAVLVYLVSQGVDLPAWADAALLVLATGGATYGAKNPKRVKRKRRR